MKESNSRPLLSIIVPSFNQGEFLKESIDSALLQDYRPIEIIVIDGASTDSTIDVLRSYEYLDEVRWISEPDGGPAEAVNKGLALAQGAFSSIQSADDYYLPGAFSKAIGEFMRHPEVGLIYGEVQSIGVDGDVKSVSRRPPHSNAMCIALCICIPQCSAFFKTSLARELGGWRTDYHTADWDLWLRMMFSTQALKLDDVMSCWRVYPGQRTDQREKVYESYRKMIDESPEIRESNWAVRRAAAASKYLIGISYGNDRRWFARVTAFSLALLNYPWIFRWVPGKTKFVPGFSRVRTIHSRVRLITALKGRR